MHTNGEENLRELFAKFSNCADAHQQAEDIRRGEELLGAYPAPEPDARLIADIKAQVTRAAADVRARDSQKAMLKVLAVAAGFIIVALVSVVLFEKGEDVVGPAIISSATWDGEDAELVVFAAEIDDIERDLLAAQLGESYGGEQLSTIELEAELIEIEGDFWEG